MFKIEDMRGSRIVYMRQVGPYGAANRFLMEKLKFWATANKLMGNDAVIVGISCDDPATTPAKNCRYDAGIVVSKDYELRDTRVNAAVLPGGRYAVFMVRHTALDIQKAWGKVFQELAANGLRVDAARPAFERYIPKMLDMHMCEICVPVC